MSLLPFSSKGPAGGGSGTVTTVSVVTANGISGSVANPTTTPAITLTLGAITPTTVNSITLSGSSTPALSVSGTSSISGSNTGDQTITLTGDVTGTGTGSFATTIRSSVALAGSPTTTTQSAGDNTTKIATDAFVTTAITNAIAGVNPAVAVSAATTSAANTSGLTYNNGVSGVGATFTGSNNTPLTFDGFTFTALGQRALVKNDTQSPSGAFNGVYYVTQVQTAILPPILTRALDYDMPSDINSTGAIPVINGTVNASTSWLLTSTVNTVGTDPLTYVQFSVNPTTIVIGPASATDGAPALFSGTSGKLIKNSTPTGTGNPVLDTSPTITTAVLGSSTATTQTALDNSTKLATTAYVDSAVTAAKVFTWNNVTGTSQSAAVNNGYITNNASLCTVTLPSTAAVGSLVAIAGAGAGGWKLGQNASQVVNFGNKPTTSGTGGSLASVNQFDAVQVICITTNTTWAVINAQGNLTVV